MPLKVFNEVWIAIAFMFGEILINKNIILFIIQQSKVEGKNRLYFVGFFSKVTRCIFNAQMFTRKSKEKNSVDVYIINVRIC